MSGKFGVSETRELVIFLKNLILLCMKEMKEDGFQPDDLKAILTDPQIASDFFLAIEGISTAKEEMKELDFQDGLEISKFLYSCVTEIVSEIRK